MFISQQACQLLKEKYLPQLDESATTTITDLFKVTQSNKGVVCLDFKYKLWQDEEVISFYSQFLLTKEGFDFIESLYTELMSFIKEPHHLVLMVERSYSVAVSESDSVLYDQPADVFALVYTSANCKFNKENPFDSEYFDNLLNAIKTVNSLSSKMEEANGLLNSLKGN